MPAKTVAEAAISINSGFKYMLYELHE